MGSTTQNAIVQGYRLEIAEKYLVRQQWALALKECEGLLNHYPSMFKNARVWAIQAYALVWLNKPADAEYSIRQSQAPAMHPQDRDLYVHFLVTKLKHAIQHGDVTSFDKALVELSQENRNPYGAGWLAAQSASVRYRAANGLRKTRARRNALLDEVIVCCQSAERIWASGSESVYTDVRLANFKVLFLAMANQSHGWEKQELAQVLHSIEKLDGNLAAQLRRKLRWRKLLGFTIYV